MCPIIDSLRTVYLKRSLLMPLDNESNLVDYVTHLGGKIVYNSQFHDCILEVLEVSFWGISMR